MRTVTRFVVPIVLVTSVALLFQGHNLPGGGFIAAVLTASGVALIYIVFESAFLQGVFGIPPGGAEVGSRAVRYYRLLFAAGLALAVGSGLVPILFGHPFLTQAFWILHGVPLYGELEVATALAFDVGVYLTVVGALLSILGVVGAE